MIDAPGPGTFTITCRLCSPEMRASLAEVARAFEDAEFACGPSYNLLAGRGKRGKASASDAPPGGEQGALEVCRTLAWRARDMTRIVARLYTDPAQAARLREMKRQHKRAVTVTVRDGRLVAYKRLADAITEEASDE